MCVYLRAHGRSIPMPNGPMSSYRNFAGQVFMRRMWCNQGKCQNAAVPGTSNHGLGISVDSNGAWICDSVPQFGFSKRHSDAPWEPWHRTWGGYGPVRVRGLELGDRTLAKGAMPGHDVRQLKRLLRSIKRSNGRRYFPRGVPINGRYGLLARRGVRRFQRDRHMPVDGVVGPDTLRALRRAAN